MIFIWSDVEQIGLDTPIDCFDDTLKKSARKRPLIRENINYASYLI